MMVFLFFVFTVGLGIMNFILFKKFNAEKAINEKLKLSLTESNERIEKILKEASVGLEYEKLLERKNKAEEEYGVLKAEREAAHQKALHQLHKEFEDEKKKNQEALNKYKIEIGEILAYQDLKETGLYSYKFKFQDIGYYNDAFNVLSSVQKQLTKDGRAFVCEATGLTGSLIVKNLEKISLLAFNASVDTIARSVKVTNFESCEEKLKSIFTKINEHLAPFNSYITANYFEIKVKELALSLEYELEKQRLKDEQDEIRAQIRDEQKELEEAERLRDEAIAKETALKLALEQARTELLNKHERERESFMNEIFQLESQLSEAHSNSMRAISNAQITSQGFVYVISNIGSFGQDMFKIGMTRRDDPMVRVRELGDASVPFLFDVHAIIESKDARKLEADLHALFEDRRVNKVNKRKEFFRVKLAEIEKACQKLNCNFKFTQLADAFEYRKSIDEDSDKVA